MWIVGVGKDVFEAKVRHQRDVFGHGLLQCLGVKAHEQDLCQCDKPQFVNALGCVHQSFDRNIDDFRQVSTGGLPNVAPIEIHYQ